MKDTNTPAKGVHNKFSFFYPFLQSKNPQWRIHAINLYLKCFDVFQSTKLDLLSQPHVCSLWCGFFLGKLSFFLQTNCVTQIYQQNTRQVFFCVFFQWKPHDDRQILRKRQKWNSFHHLRRQKNCASVFSMAKTKYYNRSHPMIIVLCFTMCKNPAIL